MTRGLQRLCILARGSHTPIHRGVGIKHRVRGSIGHGQSNSTRDLVALRAEASEDGQRQGIESIARFANACHTISDREVLVVEDVAFAARSYRTRSRASSIELRASSGTAADCLHQDYRNRVHVDKDRVWSTGIRNSCRKMSVCLRILLCKMSDSLQGLIVRSSIEHRAVHCLHRIHGDQVGRPRSGSGLEDSQLLVARCRVENLMVHDLGCGFHRT